MICPVSVLVFVQINYLVHWFFCLFFFFVDYPCSGMLGMVSGLIPDSQITASTQVDRNWIPENARLITSRSGWALPPTTHPYTNEWLQIDLGEEKKVRGIIVQGGKHRENKVFMKKFKIGYSNNGSDWKMIMDSSKKKIKVRRIALHGEELILIFIPLSLILERHNIRMKLNRRVCRTKILKGCCGSGKMSAGADHRKLTTLAKVLCIQRLVQKITSAKGDAPLQPLGYSRIPCNSNIQHYQKSGVPSAVFCEWAYLRHRITFHLLLFFFFLSS